MSCVKSKAGTSEGKSSKIFLSLICLSSSSIISAFFFSFSSQDCLTCCLSFFSLSSLVQVNHPDSDSPADEFQAPLYFVSFLSHSLFLFVNDWYYNKKIFRRDRHTYFMAYFLNSHSLRVNARRTSLLHFHPYIKNTSKESFTLSLLPIFCLFVLSCLKTRRQETFQESQGALQSSNKSSSTSSCPPLDSQVCVCVIRPFFLFNVIGFSW